jgi:hypothetical protein
MTARRYMQFSSEFVVRLKPDTTYDLKAGQKIRRSGVVLFSTK